MKKILDTKDTQEICSLNSLQKIPKHTGLSFITLYDFLISGKYGDVVDFDVFLVSKGFNLQRPYVWDSLQQEEFIWSCILGRPIPDVVFIQHEFTKWLVIDGKQRLLTLKRFMSNEFPITYKNEKYYWDDLSKDLKHQINCRTRMHYTSYHSYDDELITDDEKIIIFNFCNFSGTPQDLEHKTKLMNSLNA